jgi:hypothetical protein
MIAGSQHAARSKSSIRVSPSQLQVPPLSPPTDTSTEEWLLRTWPRSWWGGVGGWSTEGKQPGEKGGGREKRWRRARGSSSTGESRGGVARPGPALTRALKSVCFRGGPATPRRKLPAHVESGPRRKSLPSTWATAPEMIKQAAREKRRECSARGERRGSCPVDSVWSDAARLCRLGHNRLLQVRDWDALDSSKLGGRADAVQSARGPAAGGSAEPTPR